MDNTTPGYIYHAGESELRWMGKTSTHFLVTGSLTGGIFALVEEHSVKGISVPLHKHDQDVESFYFLEGNMSFFFNNEPGVRASAGSFVHIPAGTVHGFRIESATVHYLILTPPHHAEFYGAITLPATEATIDDDVIGKACAEYGVDFVGPLPD